jgi:flagellar hook-associated protein 2
VGSALSGDNAIKKTTSDSFDIVNGTVTTGNLDGSITLTYGSSTVSVSFSTDEVYDSATELAKKINEKLENKNITFSNSGETVAASTRIKAVADENTGEISFELVKDGDTNGVWISSASGSIGSSFFDGVDLSSTNTANTSFTYNESDAVNKDVKMVDYLADKGFSITLDSSTQTIKGPTETELQAKAAENGKTTWDTADYVELLQEKIDKAFGTNSDGKSKLEVTNAPGTEAGKLALQFSVATNSGSTFRVTSAAGEKAGISGSLCNYVDTSNTLGDLISNWTKDDGTERYDIKQEAITDADGNVTGYQDATDSNGNKIYTVTINGVDIDVTKDTTLSTLLTKIGSSDANLSATYSKTTKMFSFTAKSTGSTGEVTMGNDLAKALFGDSSASGANYTKGQDASVTAVVNGQVVNLTPTSNKVEIDGLTLNLKGTFDASNSADATDTSNAVTFNVSCDTDKIVDAIQSMVNEYNSIVTSIRSAFTTMPATKSDGSSYEPLSDDDKADMSETAITNYETKAKQGILYMDNDLSSLYSALRDVFSSSTLKSIGISTSYSDGLTTVSLDTSTLRQALEDDPDSVRDKFTSSTSTGGTYNGLMTKLSTICKTYVSTSGATKGILIEKAGSSLASSSLTTNTWYKAISSLEEQIEKWQDKLSDKVDYYTTKFTNLETLISQMNSQSSMLSSLSGY